MTREKRGAVLRALTCVESAIAELGQAVPGAGGASEELLRSRIVLQSERDCLIRVVDADGPGGVVIDGKTAADRGVCGHGIPLGQHCVACKDIAEVARGEV